MNQYERDSKMVQTEDSWPLHGAHFNYDPNCRKCQEVALTTGGVQPAFRADGKRNEGNELSDADLVTLRLHDAIQAVQQAQEYARKAGMKETASLLLEPKRILESVWDFVSLDLCFPVKEKKGDAK
jgi:hypothetical protein